jgi:hypothetical protein
VNLSQSQKALSLAEQAFDRLTAVATDSEAFRDEFVPCIGMIQRVGSIIDHETKGHRTQDFGIWWTSTSQDPLFRFIRDARNAEFKRAEDMKRAEHDLQLHDIITVSDFSKY